MLRDLFVVVSLYGIFLAIDGLRMLNAVPKSEVIGGGQVIIGAGTIGLGWLFLHFYQSYSPGRLENWLDKLICKLRPDTRPE